MKKLLVLFTAFTCLSFGQLKVTGIASSNQVTSLAPSATTDTTNASNITSGTISPSLISTSMFKPPYIVVGGKTYIASTGDQATLPNLGTWTPLAGYTMPTITTGANGDQLVPATSYLSTPATTSIDIYFSCVGVTAHNGGCGVFLYDSTNSLLYQLYLEATSSGSQPYNAIFQAQDSSYNGSAAPSFVASQGNIAVFNTGTVNHVKIYVVSGIVYADYHTPGDADGDGDYYTLGTWSPANVTIAKAGIKASSADMVIYSVVVK